MTDISNLPVTELKERARAAGPVLESQDRITASVAIHHEHHGSQPFSQTAQFSAMLETIEQPYTRRMVVDDAWQSLDAGWVGKPGYVLIENRAGGAMTRKPSEEELEELKLQVLFVSASSGAGVHHRDEFIIRPGRFFAAELAEGCVLRIRAAKPKTQIAVHVFPR